jgi:hypothetical protein
MRRRCTRSKCRWHDRRDPTGPIPGEYSILDAVVTASRVLVSMAARSLADVGEEVTLTQSGPWWSWRLAAPRS